MRRNFAFVPAALILMAQGAGSSAQAINIASTATAVPTATVIPNVGYLHSPDGWAVRWRVSGAPLTGQDIKENYIIFYTPDETISRCGLISLPLIGSSIASAKRRLMTRPAVPWTRSLVLKSSRVKTGNHSVQRRRKGVGGSMRHALAVSSMWNVACLNPVKVLSGSLGMQARNGISTRHSFLISSWSSTH